jgi:hypothetical protein
MPSGGSREPGPVVGLANERAGALGCAAPVCLAVAQGLAFSPARCDINAQALSARVDSGGSGGSLGRSGRGHPTFG